MNIKTPLIIAASLLAIGSQAAPVTQPYPAPEPGARLSPPVSEKPSINGARIFGVTPGAPLLYTIAASGERPMTFAAKGLPEGAKLDPKTGMISGKVTKAGSYKVTLGAKNAHGQASRELTLVVGDTICLTPPMAWNSWYSYSEAVGQENILKTARLLRDTGLINHGWSYVNIDDCWQGSRGGKLFAIQPNSKFPDIKAMCDEIHSMGLKAGIYSTPWMGTYAGFIGGSAANEKADISAQAVPENDPARRQETQFFGGYPGLHKQKVDRVGPHWFFDNDAKQWAEWGFDYVKVDWLPNDVPTTDRIAKDLKTSGRDIILSLSNAAPFENVEGLSKTANAWRTTGDIHDSWNSIKNIGFSQAKWQPYTKPGHWNDPDILQIGNLGTPNAKNTTFKPTGLSPDEQYTQVTLWCILSSPLLISCDLENLNEFTKGLLTNDEVIAVNQDPAANPAKQAYDKDNFQVWTKVLSDGSVAVGFFNLGEEKRTLEIDLKEIDLKGQQTVRDLWKREDAGTASGKFSIDLNKHGATFLQFKKTK